MHPRMCAAFDPSLWHIARSSDYMRRLYFNKAYDKNLILSLRVRFRRVFLSSRNSHIRFFKERNWTFAELVVS